MQPSFQPRHGVLRWLVVTAAGTAAACLLAFSPAQAQDAPGRARTESPYFFVASDDPGLDRLPLKSTQVDVRISGVIADVTVTQHYRNEGRRAIDARYVFPGSTRAAVSGMNVRVADRLITARIREKQQARVEFDQARTEGRTAALLEQHLPNVFQMNVANILPGDEVKVELRYTELLLPQAGNYQFVFPTVVGPRYNSPQSQQAGATWVAQPVLPAGVPGAAAFDLRVALSSPIGIKELRSPTHRVEVTGEGEQRAGVALAGSGPADNRDFILDYRLAGDRIESGVMLYRGPEENFFLAMVEPPKHVAPAAISPREYIFVVDISGSMHGFPLDTAKAMLRNLIGGLKPSDRFNVLLFSGSNRFLAPQSVPATGANIEQAIRTIENFRGGGSTELIPALRRVYAEPRPADLARTVVVVTDGYVTVEREAFELVRRHLSDASVFAFGIGSSVNRHLIEGLARAGMGEPFVITDAAQAPQEAARFRRMVESPVLTSVRARFEGLDVYDVEPQQLPDVLGERPVLVFGKWRGDARGQVVVEGMTAAGPHREAIPVGPHVAQDAAALRHLWARHRIARLTDQEALEGGDGLRQQITALGLGYGLLTQYTSFLAVDTVVRHPGPDGSTPVDQPSPMPQGVSNLAVGAEVPGTPEPATWGAVLVVGSVLVMLARRARRQRAGRYTA
ncbi:MAG TPA: VIT domain-containing protein [Ramlibacter sp.]|jgi:Ca-activated chloride channel family protein|uniref:VIT domain-containing protein n=1 Tax=Ramlibacter sp. TaxID=1917967 RepID=UPI002D5A2EF6|nr:VIT domain-containing protein [Ramlibacter sp.]HZY18802.1 VIT domain-containing protein [Ramlibacter sp.]